MKGKSKKLPTLRSNSTKKLTMRNKSHPGHEINLDKMFAQMKSDILNEMKKVAEIKFNEHKVNILKLLNKSQVLPTPKKKVRPPTKSEKKEKKGKLSSDDDITYIGPEPLNPKIKEKNKKSKKRTPNIIRKNRTPSKVDKQKSIHLTETPRSRNTSTDPKIPKKSKIRKSCTSDNVAFLGNKRKRGKENFVNLNSNNSEKASSVKKKKITNQVKKPSIKKKGK
jgi:hypothetical protein